MIINDLDDYYIVFDTKNRNTELDTLSIYYILPNKSNTFITYTPQYHSPQIMFLLKFPTPK